jgi:hypothetical protein
MGFEEWRPTEYPGYEVSDQGRVRSIERYVPGKLGSRRRIPGRVLSQYFLGRYPAVKMPGGKHVTVHRLVAKAFVLGEAPGLIARHWDDVPTNNVPSNLRWGTRSENGLDRVRNGNHQQANKTHCIRDHEFTPENTWHLARGERVCKTCARLRERRAA